ncbi:MAG: DUF2812 domain-containing protein [Anaerovoracaceae bacterium]|jgi:hypothetical protein
MKDVRRILPFGLYEFEYMESWLNAMARKGLLLKHINGFFGTFERGEPRNRRYRCIPTVSGLIGGEEAEFYEDSGWHQVDAAMTWNLFYTDDESSEELFTDPTSFRTHVRKFLWGSLLLVVAYFLFAGLLLRDFNVNMILDAPLHYFDEIGLIFGVFLPLLMAACLAILVKIVIGFFGQAYRIIKKKEIRHNVAYGKRKKVNIGLRYIFVLCLLGFILGIFTSPGASYKEISYETMAAYKGVQPVHFRMIDEKNWLPFEKALKTNIWPEDLDYSVDQRESVFFKQIVNLSVGRQRSNGQYLQYSADYYVAKSERIVGRYVKEEVGQWKAGLNAESIAVPLDGVDYAGYYRDKKDDQHLILQKGEKLEIVYYRGELDLKDYIHLFADNLNL